MKHIFEEVNLPHLKMKNRLIRSATWEGVATRSGGLKDISYKIYEELAQGGIGAIITGFTSVDDQDTYFDGMMRLSHDALIPEYRKLTHLIHQYDVPVIAQLALGAYYEKDEHNLLRQIEPDALNEEQILKIIDLFRQAAFRAKQAGYDGVQIHAAHFFFLSRFISPAINHRHDDWGGNTQKRSRILLEILNAIRETAPTLHISIKINCCDFVEGGLEFEESMKICQLLSEAGIDSIEVSGNGTSVAGIKAHKNEAYFGDFAVTLANRVKTPIILVGGLRSKDTMEMILNETNISLLSLSRPLLREPDWPNKLKDGSSTISQCISCNRCYSSPDHRCIFRK